ITFSLKELFMKLGRLAVRPRIPTALARLEELAYNLWWSWHTEAQALYERLDPVLWDAVNHNPIKLLHRIEQEKLDAAARDAAYLDDYHAVLAAFDEYMSPDTPTWFGTHHGDKKDQLIA